MTLGKYTYEQHCARNAAKIFHNRRYDERLDDTIERNGQTALNVDDRNVEYVFGKARYTGAFDSWKKGQHDFFDEVSKKMEGHKPSIYIPEQGKKSPVNWRATLTAYGLRYHGKVNDFGKMVSAIAQLREDFADYLRSDEGQALMQALMKEGYESPRLNGLKIEPHEHGVMGVYLEEKALFRNSNWREYVANAASEWAKKTGLDKDTVEELIARETFAEEVTHLFHAKQPKHTIDYYREEVRTKEFVTKFYEKLAKKAGSDQQKAKLYSALHKIKEADLKTVGRYWQMYLGIQEQAQKLGYRQADIDALIEAYAIEAIKAGNSEESALERAVARAEADIKEASAKKNVKEAVKSSDDDSDSQTPENAESEGASESSESSSE